MDRRAEKVARRLRDLGVRGESIVGLLADRSLELIVGLLGIVKAGAAYLPLDPAHPVERRRFMLRDAGATALVVGAVHLAETDVGREVIVPVHDDTEGDDSSSPPADKLSGATTDSLAYVIYTSGSTGQPKGVLITHGNVVRLFRATEPFFGFSPDDVWTLFHSVAFDFSVWEIWGALAYGGQLVIVPAEVTRDPVAFLDLLERERVTVLNQTPTAFRMLMDVEARASPSRLASLRFVIFGGEALPMPMLGGWFARHGDVHPRLVNMYGITETTVHVTYRPLSKADIDGPSLIGFPIPDLELLLLGNDLTPVDDGEPGEIHVGGAGLARGYLGRPDLTAERFVPNPFTDEIGARLYRSGDLGRRLPNGDIEYLGRIDQQVKIRGHRVEPGEIEAAILGHPLIRAAAVIPFKPKVDGEIGLAAFVARGDQRVEAIDGFRNWLAARLLQAFVPARIVVVETLPINLNGKVDRSRLLAILDEADEQGDGDPPRPGTESTLAAIWSELLPKGHPSGRDDDFFASGGHSLLAMRLVAAIERQFHVRLPVTAVFENRSLARFAEAIDRAVGDGVSVSDDGQLETPPPETLERRLAALPAQRGMWLLDAMLPDRATYNQPFAFRPDGPVDWDRLRRAFERAIERHGALRSCLIEGSDGPVQRILPLTAVTLPWAVETAIDDASIDRALFDEGRRPFDLSSAPLWRATVFPRAGAHGVLLLNFHHAIIDDWSLDLLLREIADTGGADEDRLDACGRGAPPLSTAERARCVAYWQETLAGVDGRLPWPGRSTPAVGGAPSGGLHRFVIDGDLAGPLRALSRATGATEFQILLAAFHVWLRRMTGADDVVVGTPVSSRRGVAEQGSFGCYLNTLPVRVRWDTTGATRPSFVDHVQQVEQTMLSAVGHGELPFDEIVAVVNEGATADRPPIVTTLFVATPTGVPSFRRDGVTFDPVAVDTATAKFDLTLFLEGDGGSGWRGAFEFSRQRFDDRQIAVFVSTFTVLLRSLLSTPAESVERAPLLSADERSRMLGLGEVAGPVATDGGLIARFHGQVAATPDAAAVTWSGGSWSYADLDRHAGRIATRLRRDGVSVDDPVAICLSRSPELQAAILGVFFAGGGCVPLDPTLPPERLAAMVAIARCERIVTDRRHAGLVAAIASLLPEGIESPRTLVVDGDSPDEVPAPNPTAVGVEDDSLAYVLFTSGSTGVPKGVEMPIGPLGNLVAWQCRHSVVGRGARTLQFASAGFDVSFQELFATWLSGGELVLVPEEARVDPAALLHLVMDSGVERMFLPVAVLEHLAEAASATGCYPPTLREVIVAGEQLRIGPAIRGFFARLPDAILWNQYGPTESHVVTSSILSGPPVDWPDLPPIGRPIAGAVIRLLDAALEPVPPGVAGEIWIGGECLSRGYAGRPDLTAERFCVDPFDPGSARRIYRSGDIGRWREDGQLEYLGRADRQVKIRGHRVEPDEVEALLAGHPSVAEAAVVARRDANGAWFLVAHVVPAGGAACEVSDLVGWLAARLPAAMTPERIGVVERLPLTANGKLDRRVIGGWDLPALVGSGNAAGGKPAAGLEQALADVWLALLGRGVPDREDDFFRVGGNSLSAMRLVSRVRRQFGIEATVRDVFDHPTLAGLAARWFGSGAPARRVPVPSAAAPSLPETLPATAAQKGMWFLTALLADQATYNQPFAFRPDGPIDWGRFREALGRSMDRHPALRSCLVATDDGPVQRIVPRGEAAVPWAEDREATAASIGTALRDHARIPFDLASPPLWRATLFPRAAPHGVLLLVFHHAIIDDWSIDVLLRDLARIHDDLVSGNGATEPATTVVPAPMGSIDPDADRAFWTAELAGCPDGVAWPGALVRTDPPTGRGETLRFRVGLPILEAWRRLADETGATLFQALLAACHAWVHRSTGTADSVIATPIAGRSEAGAEEAVGCFLNTVPTRVRWDRDPVSTAGTAADLIRDVSGSFLRALDHGRLAFDEIVACLPGGHAGRAQPVTNVMFVFLEGGAAPWRLGGTNLERIDVDTATSRFDLTLALLVDGDGCAAEIEYATDVFDAAHVERLAAGFRTLLGAVAAEPAIVLGQVDLLPAGERRRVLHDFNATARDLGPPATLQELFAAQVERTPGAVAVESGGESLSYAELAARVHRLARFLRTRGVGPDVVVGVCMERSVEMVVALLGILSAGGAYLPLDPETPPARLATMVGLAAPPIVLVQDRFAGSLAEATTRVFRLDTQWRELAAFDDGPPAPIGAPGDLAYVIFTSGSTGAPKGVMNTHAGIVNRLRWGQDAYRIGPDDRVLQKTPFGFDVSVWEFFWPLLVGARLVMAPPGLHRDPAALAELVESAGITVIHFVPSMLEVFLEVPGLERAGRSLRHVITSGEALGEAAMRKCLQLLPARLHNLYGPTEAAVEVTSHECRRDDPPGPVPIGRPIANMRTYVLDSGLQPVGVGREGELWLSGVGVARGYLGRDDLTAERFRPDPFAEDGAATMYRTGDLARWRADGGIDYLGRLDHQVKIRGVRIELGEIEAEVERIEGVTRAVVVDREIVPGDRRLVAYLVAAGTAPDDATLRDRLASRLPDAMVPWRFVRLDALPTNANGKLDRAALPLPEDGAGGPEGHAFDPPQGPIEEGLAAIWRDLLGVAAVGRGDGFFARGGHSLLSMRLVAAIERRFGVRLPVRAVFATPKLADLAAFIGRPPSALPESSVALTTVPAGDDVVECRPMPAQRGMWLLHALLPDPAAYNVPIAWRVAGAIDWPRLERALAAVVGRHPALRTGLVERGGDVVQRVLPPAAVAVPWRVVSVAEGDLPEAIRGEVATPFELATAPLLRAVRFDVAGADGVLLLVLHHAVVDEWSIGILRDDLAAAYDADGADPVPSLGIVTATGTPEDLERHRRFWREELDGAPPETALPGRILPPVAGSGVGRTFRFSIDGDSFARLRRLAGDSGVTIFNLLLAATHAWLRRVTGESDLVIGTPVATRGGDASAGAVGCLINVLPLRLRLDDGPLGDSLTLPGLAARVQESFLRALDHADLPFDAIVAAAVPGRQGGRQPLVNVLLTVVETGRRTWTLGPATLHPLPVDVGTSRFDLSVTLEVSTDGLGGTVEFAAAVVDDDVAAGCAARFGDFLREAATDPAIPLERMTMLAAEERHRVIDGLNDAEVDLGSPVVLHRLFAEQAASTPEAVAIREGDRTVTYATLAARAERISARLRHLGIGPGDRVAVAVPRSTGAVAAMLGVLGAGAAWVPIDREASPARAALIATDARVAAVVDTAGSDGWPAGIPIVDPADPGSPTPTDGGPVEVDASAPAYVMYTSGSTGRPKGVVIPHAAVVNYLRGKQRRFPLQPGDVVLHATRTTFDISVYEVFGPLLAGASLVILPPGRTDPVRVAEVARDAGVTVAQFVPSLLSLLVDDDTFTTCPTLRRVFCGGEAMPIGLMERFLERSNAELVNVYGPTEATVWATAWVCRRNGSPHAPPIGRPLDNVRCYVLDGRGRPVPAGTVGELFIGGDQLALGYHDRPELTAERFLPDPFTAVPGARMYRTGDACRWRPDGLLEFVARTDHQVKIRGHRIEPAEIETCLAGHPGVAAAAVVVVDPPPGGAAMLVAAVVPRGGALDADTLRRWTAERLPEAMVPARVVALDALPLNAHGKLDRRELAARIAASTVTASVAPPRTADPPRVMPVLGAQVRAAWQRVFGRIDFGDDANFFHDLGGQSILAARLAADLSGVLGRRVPLAAVFEAPTVTAMTALLRDEGWRPRFRAIVPLQPLGDGPPLFLFHGVGGGVSENLELARALGPDVPVYGLQAIDRDGGEMQPSLEAFGALYAAEIAAFQPEGPCFLGGFSLGGWFAHETARQLRLAGREVALLAQFDTHVNCILPAEVGEGSDRVLRRQYVRKHLRRVLAEPANCWRYLRRLPARFRLARQWQVADPIRTDRHGALVAEHRALPYPGPVDYFQSAESLPAVVGVWRRWCRGGLTVHRVPGDHHQIIVGPNAVLVADILRGIRRNRVVADGAGPRRSVG